MRYDLEVMLQCVMYRMYSLVPRPIFLNGPGYEASGCNVTHYAVVLETKVQPCQVLLHVTGHYITSS